MQPPDILLADILVPDSFPERFNAAATAVYQAYGPHIDQVKGSVIVRQGGQRPAFGGGIERWPKVELKAFCDGTVGLVAKLVRDVP